MSLNKETYQSQLMDWLYGSLDAQKLAGFEAYLAANPEARAEANGLKQTRGMFRQIEEIPVPEKLTAMLLREAAQHNEKKGPIVRFSAVVRSTFRGVFSVTKLPIVSAMAMLVLVAGVAGLLYSRDSPMVTQPTVSSAATAPETNSANTRGGAMLKHKEVRDGLDTAPLGAPPPVEAVAEESLEDHSRTVDLASAESEKKLQAQRIGYGEEIENEPARVAKTTRSKKNKRKPSKQRRERFAQAPKRIPAQSVGNAVSGADVRYDDVFADDSADSDEVEESESRPLRDVVAAPQASAKSEVYRKEKSAVTWEEQQAKQLAVAVQKKRCVEAGRIANDIRDRNLGYYERNLAGTKLVQPCQVGIAKETRLRNRQRAKANTKSAAPETNKATKARKK